MSNLRSFKLVISLLLILLPEVLGAQAAPLGEEATARTVTGRAEIYLKLRLDNKLKLSTLQMGDVVQGSLLRDVYSGYRKLFPAGSIVQLTVDKVEKRRRQPNDHWPWVVNVFMPRHEKYPTFQAAKVLRRGSEEVPLQVTYMSIGRENEVQTETKKHGTGPQEEGPATSDADVVSLVRAGLKLFGKAKKSSPASLTANFEALVGEEEMPAKSERAVSAGTSAELVRIASGTRAKVILLEGISASHNHEGDFFQVRLVEPVFVDSTVVMPEGSTLQGKVVRRTPPRMLSRSGSLLLSFIEMKNKGGKSEPIEATVSGVELDSRSRTRIDAEGKLQGDRPGMKWMVLNLAATGGIAKLTDDGLQFVIEAIVSSATDVSTAGTARIVAVCVSGVFLLTRHGRDVVLPKGTEMEIVFDRPVTILVSPKDPDEMVHP